MLVVDPPGQRRTLRPVLTLMMVMMPALSVLCAAVFTEPAIPQIEEVGRLVHRPELTSDQRRESGDSINCTGTDICRPFRQIFT